MIAHPAGLNERIASLDAYWRAANYLGAAQLYLRDDALLSRPLTAADCKPRPLGHWGTQPGLNLIYAHLNRLIADHCADVLLVVGPGHGAPGILANLFLEGTLEDFDPAYSRDAAGIAHLVRQFSWPGGAASHLTAQTPGSLHEGGELGYSLSHAFGAAFDNPGLIVACIVGDGEAETGPLAAAWQSNKFLNPARDGAVLPIVHLNGYKLSGPALFARMTNDELASYFSGLGYKPLIVEAEFLGAMHAALWDALETAYAQIREIRAGGRWPVILLRSDKGVTGPAVVDGKRNAGTTRSHGLPFTDPATNPQHLELLAEWLASYEPAELFEPDGSISPAVKAALAPRALRMGVNAHANGGRLLVDLNLPEPAQFAVAVPRPGGASAMATAAFGRYFAHALRLNETQHNLRLFCPDETSSNKLDAVFGVTDRAFMLPVLSDDEHLSPDGRVMEILSEHTCEGWLEGYLLSGRHGVFACYEGFIGIVDSMMHQYAKWLKVSAETSWRAPVASLNFLLTSHVWRQDHNGYSHQGPGFIDTLLTKKSQTVRVYLPPDANTLLSVMDHCLRSRNYINVVVAAKNEMPQWCSAEAAFEHCAKGIDVWPWAGRNSAAATVVLAACGDVPTLETLAAAQLLRERVPQLDIRVVNVVDLMKLAAPQDHPHGLSDGSFEALFGQTTPVVMAFHGYPRVVHELIHHRPEPARFHVRGYEEEGATTTPFDMVVRNRMSRYHLAAEAVRRSGLVSAEGAALIAFCAERLDAHARYIVQNGVDLPEVANWQWM